ncbi:hypothetical protein MRB53_014901 [Persea americana]|uniref:Uncharacterized protein n=1 Tax=Persea americana TaxID=3435 RepID=A0ACC2KCN0_PERAE|nr:hypothetical protein MRB53_014901 [Persea americana]
MFKGVSGALGRTDKAEEGFYPDAPTVNFRRIIHHMGNRRLSPLHQTTNPFLRLSTLLPRQRLCTNAAGMFGRNPAKLLNPHFFWFYERKNQKRSS